VISVCNESVAPFIRESLSRSDDGHLGAETGSSATIALKYDGVERAVCASQTRDLVIAAHARTACTNEQHRYDRTEEKEPALHDGCVRRTLGFSGVAGLWRQHRVSEGYAADPRRLC
jgi:hypothetical protein